MATGNEFSTDAGQPAGKGVQIGGWDATNTHFNFVVVADDGTILTSGGGGGGGAATIADGADVAEGAVADAVVAAGAAGTVSAKLRRLTTDLGTVATNTGRQAAANLATGQVTTSTTAATFVVARATRRGVMLKNLDASIKVYYGPATVTAGNGMELKGGESTVVNWVGLIQVISASGTPVVAYSDEYD